jgi:serine/threonine protein kinase
MNTSIPLILNGKYRILNKIGEGKFGQVFKGKVLKGRRVGEPVAIKYNMDEIENGNIEYSNIAHESKMINYLNQKTRPTNKFPYGPQLFWYGVVFHESDSTEEKDQDQEIPQEIRTSFMVTTYYELSLTQFLDQGGSGTRKLILGPLMDQMIEALRHIHKLYVIHRDIKPSNFMVEKNQIRLIDFGMSTFYLDGETGEHIKPPKEPSSDPKKELVGSPNYISPFVHEGWPNSRRDDYISMAYVILFYLSLGGSGGTIRHLPWEGLAVSPYIRHSANQERYRRKLDILNKKEEYQIPDKLYDFIKRCYALKFEEDLPQEDT